MSTGITEETTRDYVYACKSGQSDSQLVEDVQRLQASLKKLQETTSIHVSLVSQIVSWSRTYNVYRHH